MAAWMKVPIMDRKNMRAFALKSLTRSLDKRTGQTVQVWKKVARNNEALDLLVYSLALVHHVGIGFLINQADEIAMAAKQRRRHDDPEQHKTIIEYGEDMTWKPSRWDHLFSAMGADWTLQPVPDGPQRVAMTLPLEPQSPPTRK